MRAFKILTLLLGCTALAGGVCCSCNSDDIAPDAMYTFQGETVSSFCHSTPQLSLFSRILDEAGSDGLLQLYGHFTCFAPSNAAIEQYLSERGITIDQLTQEQREKIVNNCIIRGSSKSYLCRDFVTGTLSMPTMSDRYIIVSFADNELGGANSILINAHSLVVSRDNEVHNGVVHIVDRVIEPSEKSLLEVLESDGRFTVWAQAYRASGYYKEMEGLYDDSYVNTFGTEFWNPSGSDWTFRVPLRLKLGYTLFAEPDALLAQSGITDLRSLEEYATRYYGREDLGNYTSPANPLNRFVAYHLTNRILSTSTFVYSGMLTTPEYASRRAEYYETYYKYHIMEIKAGGHINERKDGSYVGIDEHNSNIEAVNGFVHTLRHILVYDEDVMRNDVLHKRIRYDFMSIPPQFTNNNLRWNVSDRTDANGCTVTPDFCGEYFTYSQKGQLYLWGSNGWASYQADEMSLNHGFDFTFRLVPLPPGNWEMRLGFSSAPWRGIAQLFMDGNIVGTPVDMRVGQDPNDPRVGWVADEDTPDNGIENDKLMRNLGFMKAPEAIWYAHSGYVLRKVSTAYRYIVGQFSFGQYAPHYFRSRNVDFEGREFSLDYVEFIPTDMIRDEDRG